MATSQLITEATLEKLLNVAKTEARLAVGEDTKYLYDTLAPTISVNDVSGTAWVFEADSSLNKTNDIITPRSAPNEIGGSYSAIQYTTQEHAIRMLVTDKDVKMYGNRTILVQQAMRNVISALRGNMELRFFEKFLNNQAGWKVNITGQATAGNLVDGKTLHWSDAASTPLEDIEEMKEISGSYAGNNKLNRALIAKDVWNALKKHPDISTRLQGKSDVIKTDTALQQEFATLIEVERVDVIDQWQYTKIDKIQRTTDDIPMSNVIENASFTRPFKGIFMLYRYEPSYTLANKSAFNIIDASKNMFGFNRGIPTVRMYRHHDEGILAMWVEGRISAGLHLSNPAGAVFAENMIA